jgi:hypothetical protein
MLWVILLLVFLVQVAAMVRVVRWLVARKVAAAAGAGEEDDARSSSGPPSGTRRSAVEAGEVEGIVLPFREPRLLRPPRQSADEGAVLAALIRLEGDTGCFGIATFAQAARMLNHGRRVRLPRKELCARIVAVAQRPGALTAPPYILTDMIVAAICDGDAPADEREAMLPEAPGGAA